MNNNKFYMVGGKFACELRECTNPSWANNNAELTRPPLYYKTLWQQQ